MQTHREGRHCRRVRIWPDRGANRSDASSRPPRHCPSRRVCVLPDAVQPDKAPSSAADVTHRHSYFARGWIWYCLSCRRLTVPTAVSFLTVDTVHTQHDARRKMGSARLLGRPSDHLRDPRDMPRGGRRPHLPRDCLGKPGLQLSHRGSGATVADAAHMISRDRQCVSGTLFPHRAHNRLGLE